MKKYRIIMLTLIALLLGACATTTPTSHNAEMTKAQKYRALVSAEADKKSVDLTWVNPPDEDDLEKYRDL
jgi:outer membrane biogenesis lipoprotein LolB